MKISRRDCQLLYVPRSCNDLPLFCSVEFSHANSLTGPPRVIKGPEWGLPASPGLWALGGGEEDTHRGDVEGTIRARCG